ncbi:MAG: hypothetical protein M0P71_18135 [Melioribacteraceae bacterium]|jgi:hypothetical protein|nr:hypothetical protein [Melioribacteraceae bacterium]
MKFESYWIPWDDRKVFYTICLDLKIPFKELAKTRKELFGYVFCFKMTDSHYYTLASLMGYAGYQTEIGTGEI